MVIIGHRYSKSSFGASNRQSLLGVSPLGIDTFYQAAPFYYGVRPLDGRRGWERPVGSLLTLTQGPAPNSTIHHHPHSNTASLPALSTFTIKTSWFTYHRLSFMRGGNMP